VYVAPRFEQRDGRWRLYTGGWDRRAEEEPAPRERTDTKAGAPATTR
jgi:hypothetical protein